MAKENDAMISCWPGLIKDGHCDLINFSRALTYPFGLPGNNRRRVNVEVILLFKFSRCTHGLTLGYPVCSTPLLPGEKLRLAATDRRSRFSFHGETKLSYISEQIPEEQYFIMATQKYLSDTSSAQSGHKESSSEGYWDFHGDPHGSVNPFGPSASSNASGNHNSSSVPDNLNQQKKHVQSFATRAVSVTRKAHSVSIGEVSSHIPIQGKLEDHFEAATREFIN